MTDKDAKRIVDRLYRITENEAARFIEGLLAELAEAKQHAAQLQTMWLNEARVPDLEKELAEANRYRVSLATEAKDLGDQLDARDEQLRVANDLLRRWADARCTDEMNALDPPTLAYLDAAKGGE